MPNEGVANTSVSDDTSLTVGDILSFDPFDGGSGTDDGGEAPEQSQETPETGDDQGQEGAEQQQAAPAPSPAPPTLDQAGLERLIQQQTAAITEAVRPTSAQQAAQPKFNLTPPPQLVAALRSEDPQEFSNGVGALINGVANHVWNTVNQHINEQVMSHVGNMIGSKMSEFQTQQQVKNDFYGHDSYKVFNQPQFMPLVQNAAISVVQEFQRAGKPVAWGPEMRDAIGEKLFQMFPMLRQQQQQLQQQRRAPARRFVSGGNGPGPSGLSNDQQDMMSVAGLFGPPGM